MSKEMRKADMQAASEKAVPPLDELVHKIQKIIDKFPEDYLKTAFTDDFNENFGGSLKEKILKHADEIARFSGPNESAGTLVIPDYAAMGMTNLAMQALNFLRQQIDAATKYIEKRKLDMKETEKHNAMIQNMTSAIEHRLRDGDEVGEMGAMIEMNVEEENNLKARMKKIDTELQNTLYDVIGTIYSDRDGLKLKEAINTLCSKSLKKDGDPYIEVTFQNQIPINTLRSMGLVEDHPHNQGYVKLVALN
ncbi:uncharacterized protein LOC132199963 [Neocloeon triangulifer]|uniref:uncharacterized protein LOC132199963 n=1 Tax=Neocloeon triangulifer TaxID=2078957 RepID=UPI00286EF253|nr:uncharacterized protein LOC132199963 [Neocloeon triangulifer]